MKRRKFIKKSLSAAAGTVIAPYILPSGRLFAKTPDQMAEHVVFVLFAGGVRHQESVGQRYLADSQNAYATDDLDVEGNIMYNLLDGAVPDRKIAYGLDLAGETPGGTPITKLLDQTIQQQGTLFAETTSQTASHYLGASALLSGNYLTTQGLRQRPFFPTIFEYTRKHLGLSATDVWFIGNSTGGSTPLLNYSGNEEYGHEYGANFFAPTTTFGDKGEEYLAYAKNYHPEEDAAILDMRQFLNNSFLTSGNPIPSVKNTEEERENIRLFMKDIYDRQAGQGAPLAMPSISDIPDAVNIGYACEVLKWFKPTLLSVNLSNVDACHGSFTNYVRALHRADHAVGHLWNTIQNTPGLADNTVLILAPEHGRNLEPNPIQDLNEWYAYDHSDDNARRSFAMMVGPCVDSGLKLGSEGSPIGDTSQCLLTIAEVLGFKNEIQSNGFLYSNSSFFDLI